MNRCLPALLLLGAGIAILLYFGRLSRTSSKPPVASPHATVVAPPIAPRPVPASAAATQAEVKVAAEPAALPVIADSNPPTQTPTTAVDFPTAPVQASASQRETNNLAPDILLENMRTVIRQYGLRFGGNPVGNNAEITRALNGGNPKDVMFIPSDSGLQTNGKGELIDSWGTPFFFHQLSAREMEVRSAGPDKVMWTPDDLVTK
jgi:hypothetical protein